MSIIVQKFGGTSLATSEKILAAAKKAIRVKQRGHQVVMVVSAMGKNTDILVDLAREITDRPQPREMDMLLSTGEQVSVALTAMAMHSLGVKAVSLTGAQIGIKTDSSHTKARIKSISTERIQRLLNEGNIVIAAGFQGIDKDFDITTLGRGGSDTTAVALAAVLQADACEIYTDVDGIYTTDPRLLSEARRVNQISYDEMLELASLGAGVMHSRSIEFAKKYNVPIRVCSSMTDAPGSLIITSPESKQQAVCGATVTIDEARISLLGVPDVPGTSLHIFSLIAGRKITVDMIVQNVGADGRSDISFTVPKSELSAALEAVESAAKEKELGGHELTFDDNVSKVSVVGLGMAHQTGIADRTFHALSDAEINIQMITTSEIKISVLVDRADAEQALRVLHNAFELEKTPADSANLAENANIHRDRTDAAAVVARLQGIDMEELFVDDVTLDDTQARVTINGLPDAPGIAATVFDEVAAANVFVDMIVQSFDGKDGQADLTFTVPRDKLATSMEVANLLAEKMGCDSVTSSPEIAKLSVSGVGLRSHTSVAIRMFRSLSQAGINVDLINTSEVRVNIIVEGIHSQKALACLQTAFEDVLR
ncbi:MAG: aspartate kinase [Pirellulaceae bacterium]|nr:aspartate kinase [Pirellulaceae bacterium]